MIGSLFLWSLALALGDDGPVGPADFAAYRAAIEPTRAGDPAPETATFRDLWDRPEAFRGRRVSVVGRVQRVWRQGPVGRFPALAEAWISTPAGDPICLVFPDPTGAPIALGSLLRFAGTSLRRVRYHGPDADRLAPLVVGPAPPTLAEQAAPTATDSVPSLGTGLTLGLGALVGLALWRAHLRRPARPRREEEGPIPEFLDGTDASDQPEGG